jgi:hypothetical protein
LTEHEGVNTRRLLAWLIYFSLGLSLVYSLFYAAGYLGFSFLNRGGSLISTSWDLGIWCLALFIILAWFFVDVFVGVLDSSYRIATSLILCLGLVALFAGVCFVLVGLLSLVSLSLVSLFLVLISFAFSLNVLGVSRLAFFLRLVLGVFLGLLFLGLAFLLV